MKPPFPSYTETWHNDTYDAISPRRPEVSVADKTIVIAGAGQGIGRETSVAFAVAGAAHIALLGRRANTLNETKDAVTKANPATCVSIHTASVTDEQALAKAASEIGSWDVLILNAGSQQTPANALDADMTEWWSVFEGLLMTTRAFFPHRKANAAIVGVGAAAAFAPPKYMLGVSAYTASKAAQAKVLEMLAIESPDLFVGIVHPGVVKTELLAKSNPVEGVPYDSIQLPAHFMVWVVSPEARFTHGKFLYANYDVDELKAKASQLQCSSDLTITLAGL